MLPRLHYALTDKGVPFLGKAETQLARSKLFQPIDMKHRLFQKVPRQAWRRGAGDGIMADGKRHDGGVSRQAGLLEGIIDNAASAYLAIDTDGIVVFANLPARRMLEVGGG